MEEQAKKLADVLLRDLAEIQEALKAAEAEAQAEIEKIRQKYEPNIAYIKECFQEREKLLLNLMKAEKAGLFDGKDKVSLDHGVLLYGKEGKVSIPRDALEKIERAGWLEAVKIAKSVDRGVVEKWPDEKLAVIGAMRKVKEKYEYELK